MRIRQVKPEFWKDAEVSALSPFTRLTYVGLWMLADDDGWFRHDIPTIALELYGWEPRAKREKAVTAALEELAAAGRVVVNACGKHAVVPTLVNHQRFAGETKKVYTFKREHERCPRVPAGVPQAPATAPHLPATGSQGDSGVSVRQGSSDARKRDDETTSEFQRRVPRSSVLS